MVTVALALESRGWVAPLVALADGIMSALASDPWLLARLGGPRVAYDPAHGWDPPLPVPTAPALVFSLPVTFPEPRNPYFDGECVLEAWADTVAAAAALLHRAAWRLRAEGGGVVVEGERVVVALVDDLDEVDVPTSGPELVCRRRRFSVTGHVMV